MGTLRRFEAASWLVRLAAVSVAAVALAACRPAPVERPSFVLLLVDTLRADYLGSYGFPGPISPNLDRLQRESVLFESCFSQAPWTKPSIASLLTSLYPQVHGVINYDGQYAHEVKPELQSRTGVLPERAVTLAEALRDHGYETAAFVANVWVSRAYGYAQGFDVFDESAGMARRTSADVLIEAARQWLENRSSDKPFFLYLHFMDVHAPYRAPSRDHYELLTKSLETFPDRRLSGSEVPWVPFPNIEARPRWATDEMRHALSYWRARYAAGVHSFDLRIASLLDYLRQTGLLDESYLVLTSDHGEELFEHLGWSHGKTLHEHQLRVPLLIRAPEGRGGGTRVAAIVELIDLMPTLLSLAGADPLPANQGRDVSELLRGGSVDMEDVAFATATSAAPDLFSVRTSSHKLIFDAGSGTTELYNLLADPGEQVELSQQQPQRANRLVRRLTAHLDASLADGTLDAESAEIPPDRLARLRALGYLGGEPGPQAPLSPGLPSQGPPAVSDARLDALLETVTRTPTADGYVNLSLRYFQLGEYRRAIRAGNRAVAIDPASGVAYNNICAGHNALKEWDRAIEACGKALELVPEFELAKNNLRWARANKRP